MASSDSFSEVEMTSESNSVSISSNSNEESISDVPETETDDSSDNISEQSPSHIQPVHPEELSPTTAGSESVVELPSNSITSTPKEETPVHLISVLTDSESSDDEADILQEISVRMSPRTRYSITGVRSRKSRSFFIDDSDEDEPIQTPSVCRLTPISQSAYDDEKKKYSKLVDQLKSCENLLNKFAASLPDNGAQLRLQVDKCKKEIEEKDKYLATLQIDPNISSEKKDPSILIKDKSDRSIEIIEPHNIQSTKKMENVPSTSKLDNVSSTSAIDNRMSSWDDIKAGINILRPKYTGQQGTDTFNTKRELTIKRLEKMHRSHESCPAENELAENPKGLTVQLMNHQRHALRWMVWRETQSPRGGILADDMGLGKTLTVISVILAKQKMRNKDSDDSSSSAASDDNSSRTVHEGGTLVVCPASVVEQWVKEVQARVRKNLLNVYMHHGNKRETNPRRLAQYDMVITSYNIVSIESKLSHGTLFGVKFERIVLDESQVIRNHKTNLSMGCCLLKGKFRWCLTGTPIQNKEEDIYSQLKFLRCRPFDDLVVFKEFLGMKVNGGQQRLHKILVPLLLRRTKEQLQNNGALKNLTSKSSEVIVIQLEKAEMNVYQRVLILSQSLFARFLKQRSANLVRDDYRRIHNQLSQRHRQEDDVQSHQILTLLLRLRQICCHPGLIHSMLADDIEEDEQQSVDSNIDLLADLEKLTLNETPDNQSVPTECILTKVNPVFSITKPSSKLTRTITLIQEIIDNSDDKVVVVSQWTSVLSLMEGMLLSLGIRFLKLTGQTLVPHRGEIIDQLNRSTSSYRVLLLSLTAGGVGLNLVGANHLIIMDPHWNPQLEAQAQDRVFRVGQTKPVKIYNLICQDTVESSIKELQEKKLQIAKNVLSGAKGVSGSTLSIDDMKKIFGVS